MGKWVYKRYQVGKLAIVLSVIICALSLLFIILCTYFENTIAVAADTTSNTQGLEKLYIDNYAVFCILKDVSTIVLSIIGTSLILSLALEVNSKNTAYTDFFNQEILENENFYKSLSDKNRTNMLRHLESSESFSNNAIVSDMYQNIKKRLRNSKFGYSNYDYYLTYCKYDVKCVDKNTYFERTVVRTMKFKSYNGRLSLNELTLGKYKNKMTKINGLMPFEKSSLRINGVPVSIDLIKINNIDEPDNALDAQIKYTSRQQCVLTTPIEIDESSETTIVFEYIVRTEKDDIHSTFRCSLPCKHFEVSFSADEDYTLIPLAFGFCDRAETSPNSQKDSEATICFDQWVFEADGVVIILNKKSDLSVTQ